jgi:hypothetical protein
VHRVYPQGRKVFWESEVFERGAFGFEKPKGRRNAAISARVELFA